MHIYSRVAVLSMIVSASAGRAAAQEGISFDFDDHPSIRIGDVARLDAIAKFQLDWRQFQPGRSGDWDIHRARWGVSGRLTKRIEYELERELTDKTNSWRDAYVNVIPLAGFEIRAGQFKIPFSLDQMTGVMDLDFAYRSLAGSFLAPGRDVGLLAHGRVWRRVLRYQVGVFKNGGEYVSSDERTAADTGRTFASRISLTPWRSPKSSLRTLTIGSGVTVGRLPTGLNSVKVRDLADEPVLPRLYVSGNRRRLGADVEWRDGSLSLRGEWIRTVDERRGQGTDDNDLPRLLTDGGYVSATWIATGEKKRDDLRPKKPLLHGGAGAIELAARLERLTFRAEGAGVAGAGVRATWFDPRESRALTVGVNWYLNRFVRLQANAIRERHSEPREGNKSWARIIRLQFAL